MIWRVSAKIRLKINLASKDDLLRLHLLSEVQINNLIAYREKTGTIYSLYELVAVDEFTPDVMQKLESFISFDILEPQSGKKRSSTDLFVRSNRTFSSAGQADQAK